MAQNLSKETLAAIEKVPKPLLKKVLEFNFSTGNYVHPSRLTTETNGPDAKLANFLLSNPRSQKRLSRLFNKKYALDKDYQFNFDDSLTRLALLEGDDILRIARIAAITVNNHIARTFIKGSDTAQLANLVGQDGFEFALQNYEWASQDGDRGFSSIGPFLAKIEQDAKGMLHLWLAQTPRPLSDRVNLKFPKDMLDKRQAPNNSMKALKLAAEKFVPKCLNQKT